MVDNFYCSGILLSSIHYITTANCGLTESSQFWSMIVRIPSAPGLDYCFIFIIVFFTSCSVKSMFVIEFCFFVFTGNDERFVLLDWENDLLNCSANLSYMVLLARIFWLVEFLSVIEDTLRYTFLLIYLYTSFGEFDIAKLCTYVLLASYSFRFRILFWILCS